jgi:hypothetical protein
VPSPPYPVGIPDSVEPSGDAPPSATALAGYVQTYVQDFTGTVLPTGWYAFSGIPGGDPGAHFGGSHVTVGGGILSLNTYRDKSWRNRWVTGGLCQCGLPVTYGAFFVRSRLTGNGPNEAQLLWPIAQVWPPEVDFNESGDSITGTSATIHFGADNKMDHLWIKINMTQWHTWGVIWTANSIIFTVDGQVWGSEVNASRIPHQAMSLNLQQTTKCPLHTQCPTQPVSMQVDWVAEYITAASDPTSAPTTTSTTSTTTTSTSTTTTTVR